MYYEFSYCYDQDLRPCRRHERVYILEDFRFFCALYALAVALLVFVCSAAVMLHLPLSYHLNAITELTDPIAAFADSRSRCVDQGNLGACWNAVWMYPGSFGWGGTFAAWVIWVTPILYLAVKLTPFLGQFIGKLNINPFSIGWKKRVMTYKFVCYLDEQAVRWRAPNGDEFSGRQGSDKQCPLQTGPPVTHNYGSSMDDDFNI